MLNLMGWIATAFAGGIWCAGSFQWSLMMLYCWVCLLIGIAVWCIYRQPGRAIWPVVAIFFIAGMIRFIQVDFLAVADISRYVNQTVTVYGTVTEVPQVTHVDEQKNQVRYVLDVETVHTDPVISAVATGRILISSRQDISERIALYGDKMTVTGTILLPHGYNNPGLVDTVTALKRQGIRARMSVPAGSVTLQLTGHDRLWQNRLAEWRQQIVTDMNKVMPPGDASILVGMLFGGYNGINHEVVANFAATGIVHILSVSGTHIVLVAAVILWLGTRLKIRYGVTAIVAALAILFYSVFAGLTSPVVRSAVMGLVALAAVGLGREKDTPGALALSALGMLIYQPGLIYDISFQLSFGATAGLIFLYPQTYQLLAFLPRWLAGGVAVTVAAQLGVLPFIAWYFNSFSFSSLIANLVIVPIIELIVVLGLLGALVSIVLAGLGHIILVFCSLLIGLVVQLAAGLATIPGSQVYLPPIGVAGGMLYYLLLVWLYGYQPRGAPTMVEAGRRWPRLSVGIVTLIMVILVVYVGYPRPVYVHFIDVGQGDAALFTTPRGRAVLIDTGGTLGESTSFDIGERVVVPYLKHYGVRELDYLILTHGHQDHAGGAAGIAAAMPIKNVILAREEYTPAVQALLHAVHQQRIIPAYEGQTIILDGVTFSIVHAVGDSGARSGNEVSSVVRMAFGKHSFLFTGDLEASGETAIIADSRMFASTVLKVGHHGAKTSSTTEFLEKVAPEYAVISVGYNNRFGHPHPDTIKRLFTQRITVFRTDQQGAVVFTTDGNDLTVDTFIK
jgi:competence protein ComEC